MGATDKVRTRGEHLGALEKVTRGRCACPARVCVREQQGGEVGQPLGQPALQLLHTRYHAVPKMEEANPLGIKW